jgi:hypothetical protein
MKHAFAISCLLLLSLAGWAQKYKKQLPATKTLQVINIDGVLTNAEWADAPIAGSFVSFEPENGVPVKSEFATTVRVLYDDEAIYIGAFMRDLYPDSILRQVTRRDIYNENTDWFGFFINPYNDGLSDFNFWVTAAGTQSDSRTTEMSDDFSLNSVWKSEVSINDSGWVVEAKIPYSALRFPETLTKDWGLNFMRSIRRTRQLSTWSFLDLSSGYRLEYQSGLLTGVTGIDPPVRLSAMPYVSAYADNFDGTTTADFNAGLDLKYGINESFTLDMTLIPDFGQVAYDQQFLNLTPFENQFEENRQFFTEGTELFNIGNLLYTRRIGGAPKNIQNVDLGRSDSVEIRQEYTRLLNATKISGRTKNNLGIGVLNAVTDNNFSTRIENGEETRVLTEPLTNYNVLVLDQRIRRNSSISLVNTNVLRRGSSVDANVVALIGDFVNKTGKYYATARGFNSARFQNGSIDDGYKAELGFAKLDGNWRWSTAHRLVTDRFNINDLGFQQRNNQVSHYGEFVYKTVQPTARFNKFSHTLFADHRSLYKPYKFEELKFGYNMFYLLRRFFAFGGDLTFTPVKSFDFFEPRQEGRWFHKPRELFLNGFISSDYRRTFALDMTAFGTFWDELNRSLWQVQAKPRIRLGNHFFTVLTFRVNQVNNDYGFVANRNNDIFFGQRDNFSVENAIDAQYVFTPKSSLSLAVRHTYTDVKYKNFFLLNADGSLTKSELNGVDDLNFNAFNIDLKYSWWFAPGSELVVLYRNVVASVDDVVGETYFRNVEGVFESPVQNNISIKFTYFLDYHMTKQAVKKGRK